MPKLRSIPKPRDLRIHIIKNYPLRRVFSFMNDAMLYSKHLGLKGPLHKNTKALRIRSEIESLKSEALEKKWIRPACVYSFFSVKKENDSLCLHGRSDSPAARLEFPRQKTGEHLSITDFVETDKNEALCAKRTEYRAEFLHSLRPCGKTAGYSATENNTGYIAMFACTSGKAPVRISAKLRETGSYAKSHLLDMLSISCAEALAEAVHSDIRRLWGFPDPAQKRPLRIPRAKYRGERYSFGYPSCPDLTMQKKLFRLLKPGRIGITLTNGMMMEPEASVSGLVVSSPDAVHFAV